MSTWNLGSVSTHVGNLIGWTSIGTLSGTTLDTIVDQSINYVEQYTTDTISNTAITEKYQPVIIKLTQADVLIALESQQGGVDNVSLGDLSVSQGSGGGSELAKQLKEEANLRLKELQRKIRFKRVIGA
jgi:hypothetical protein